jgi:NAD-dependent deacetylase
MVPFDKAALEECVGILSASARVVVSTGAGVSKESGIPTFRDASTGLWANYDPMQLATREGFHADPALVWRWYSERRAKIAEARPNPGHVAIAEMETMLKDFTLITQNIDNLHRAAGSTDPVEVHGNIFRYKCFDKEHPIATLPDDKSEPPVCECGSYIRPDVVWFGELLPQAAVDRVFTALENCDALLVVGTSAQVQPAAGFPAVARGVGARVIEVNTESTANTGLADVFLQGAAGEILPLVASGLRRKLDAKGQRS